MYVSTPDGPSAGRPDWDDYFLGIARAVSARAECTRRRVGAVITKDNRIISTGYNGVEPGGYSCLLGACAGDTDLTVPCIATHAEANAIIYGDRWLMEGATIYVTTWPCAGCFKLIRSAGIIRAVTPDEETRLDKRTFHLRGHSVHRVAEDRAAQPAHRGDREDRRH
jgi:dCMP deaminase